MPRASKEIRDEKRRIIVRLREQGLKVKQIAAQVRLGESSVQTILSEEGCVSGN